MCRLFFSSYNENTKNHLELFLRQMDEPPPFPLPSYSTKSEEEEKNDGKPDDGYGFAFLHKGKWLIYKSLGKRNPIFTKKYSVILGHLRFNSPLLGIPNNIYDNHPFLYRNQVFAHNGHIVDYRKNHYEKMLDAWIDPTYIKHIKGHTDSERIFFLYITILRNLEREKGETKEMYMTKAVRKMLKLFAQHNIKMVGSFIYADSEYAVVVRLGPYPLYMDTDFLGSDSLADFLTDSLADSLTGFLVTRQPVTPLAKNRMIPKNKVTIIHLQKTDFR
jgi:predicted glutamine amidotransferase